MKHGNESEMRKYIGMVFICSALLIPTGINALSGKAWAAGALQMSPRNPDFENYLIKNVNQGAVPTRQMTTPGGHSLGLIPSPFKLPEPTKESMTFLRATALPAAFDLRSSVPVGVTAVRDQGMCGSCWTFGAMASMESYLTFKKGVTVDFSEADLNESHGFDISVCNGGNHFMSTAYLARWGGPVTEKDVPYPSWLTEYSPPPAGGVAIPPIVGEAPGVLTICNAQNVYFLPQSTKRPHPVTDLNTLQTAIRANGAVSIGFYYDDMYYNATNYSYYNNAVTSPNHEVAVVGWNNNYPKTKFTPQPPGDGALIVKNSWGTSWGEAGYFYLSYYDKSIDLGAQFYDATPLTTYTRLYQYDPLGWVASLGYGASTGWFANIFMASANASRIKGVSTYTPAPNSTYTVYVYTNVSSGNPVSGTLVRTKTGSIPRPGYNTIPVDTASVTANQPFSVVIELTTPGYNYPIPIELTVSGYTSAASAAPGQSFVSSEGINWEEAYDSYLGYYNVCLKALAVK